MIKQHKLLTNLTTWQASTFSSNIFRSSEETDVNFIRPSFFQTNAKLISRHFGRNLKRTGRVYNKNRCNIKLFYCNVFFVLLEERLSLMKYMATFVLCLFRTLYQGTDKILDFPNNLYGKKAKGFRDHQ